MIASSMKYLFDNKLAPLTFSWGFLEAPVETINNVYVSWQRRILRSVKVSSINLPLVEALKRLEPLDIGSQRVLFLSTKSNWTACFDNGSKGGNPSTFVGELAERLKCRGVACGCIPNTLSRSDRGKLGTWGAVKFTLFGAEKRESLNIERSVSVINDVRGWKFNSAGVVQSFEQVDRYTTKKIAERFTAEMLEDYCRALGLELFDENFYDGPGFMTHSYPWFLPRLPSVGLTEARKQLGFVD
jgi:hypothetical protein